MGLPDAIAYVEGLDALDIAQVPPPIARPAFSPMDADQVVHVLKQLMSSGAALLEIMDEPQTTLGPALEGVAIDIADSLHTVLSWMPNRDVETEELKAAIEGFRP